MKPFLFITDFDGTITALDFFLQIMYRYEHDKVFSKRKRGVELLKEVFEDLNLTKKEFDEEIEHIPMDPNFSNFCEFVKKIGGDVLILSAGAKYYIEKKLYFEKIEDVEIISNGGYFLDGKFKFLPNEDERFLCPVFGIDKEKVVKHYKKKYEKIAYAGDSYVDFKACSLVDFRFAKGNLVKILNIFKMEFFEFLNFGEIEKKLNNLI